MKQIMYLIVGLALLSCDLQEEYLEGKNEAPKIQLISAAGTGMYLEDSIKISGDVGIFYYPVVVNVEDLNDNITIVDIDTLFNRPSLIVQSDSILINSHFIGVNSFIDSVALDIALYTPGSHDVEFIIRDAFGMSSTALLRLEVFDNLPPVAKVVQSENDLNSDIIVFNMSGSFDRDERFGGYIEYYNYILNGTEYLETQASTINHPFPGPGIYPVTMYVTDNNGHQSNYLTFNVQIK